MGKYICELLVCFLLFCRHSEKTVRKHASLSVKFSIKFAAEIKRRKVKIKAHKIETLKEVTECKFFTFNFTKQAKQLLYKTTT